MMDEPGFRQFLQERNLSEAQLAQHVAIVRRYEDYLKDLEPPSSLEQASPETARAFVDILVAEGGDPYADLLALARYNRYIKNNAAFVTFLELLDGSEVLEGMYRKVGQVAGDSMRDEIFEGIYLPPLGTPNLQKARITGTIMQRLERLVDDETCREIFSDSFRNLPEEYYLEDRKKYQEIGDFDRFLEMKREEFIAELEQIRDEGGLFFNQEITDEVVDFVRGDPEISQGVRQGDILYVTKIPYMAKEYLAETDPDLKRYYYCHCPWARESLQAGEKRVPARFCQCSAGYHKKPWEVIFERPLQAEVLESVLQGDLRCRFAIHLPADVLEAEAARGGGRIGE
jgi:hypothetical protein